MRDPTSAACFLSLFRAMTDPHGGYSEIEARENLLLLLARLIDRLAIRSGSPARRKE